MKKNIILIITLLLNATAFSQSAIGSFEAHTAMHAFLSVAVDSTTVYAATGNGLMLLDKSTVYDEHPDMTTWSKVDGLSDIDIVRIFYSQEYNTLIINYSNGNIDLIQDDRIVNIRDVKDKSLTGSKRLQLCRELDGRAYLVYPFGIVIMDLAEKIITDTWFTKRDGRQFVPTDIALDSRHFYVSTAEGVFSIEKNSPVINDFSQWQRENVMSVSFMSVVEDRVFAVRSFGDQEIERPDSLYKITENGWEGTGKSYYSVKYMSSKEDTLLVCNWDGVELLNPDAERLYYAVWYAGQNYPDVREAVLDGDDIWVADHVFGLVQNNMTYFFHHFFQISGPFMDYVEKVTSYNGVVAAVHGTRKASTAYAPGYRYPALSWYQNREWQYNSTDFLNYSPGYPTYDLTDVVINPRDESEWAVASWGNGVFKCKNHQVVEHYNAANSVLDSVQSGSTYVSGLQYDKKGNLWMTNSYCTKMLKMLEPDGTWHAYNLASAIGTSAVGEVVAEHLLVDSRGYKWVNFPRGAKYPLIAFTENGTYDNIGDDRIARIDMNAAAEVTSSTVYCMAEDHDGEIWIGTDKGVKVIYYPGKVFDGLKRVKIFCANQQDLFAGEVGIGEIDDFEALRLDGHA